MKQKKSDRGPRCPAHLTDEVVRARWKEFTETYDFSDPDARLRLELGLGAYGESRKHDKILEIEGSVQTDRFGFKRPHPSVAISRNLKVIALKAFKELGLDIEMPSHRIGRPPLT